MKKILICILTISMLFMIIGCGTNQTKSKLQITTTIFPYYSFVNEICADNADITMLIKQGAEIHTYDPTAQEILKIQNSDVFIYTGGESDAWVETILSSIDTNKTKIIKVMDLIKPVSNNNHDHKHTEEYDEHVWTSPKNAIVITHQIAEVLCEIDSENSELYKQKENEYKTKLQALDSDFEFVIKSSDKTVIFADRFPFLYFAEEYNLKYISAFPSCSEESEPSVKTMAEIIDTVNTENISTVFYTEFSNKKIADTIQSETGVKKLLFHSCHNVTKNEFDSGATYLSLMQQNLENLKEAIK